MMYRAISFFLASSCLFGCTKSTPNTPPDTTNSPEQDMAVEARPDDSGQEPALRPNVQEGTPPNATGQKPAFAAQTRAPQPARPTSVKKDVLASGLGIPWGIAPLPDGRLLVTERSGQLRMVQTDGSLSSPLGGLPDVAEGGQGGLLDVTISPDFASDRLVFFTFSEARGDGLRATSIARAALSTDGSAVEDWSVIYRQEPARDTTRHFGSRLVFDTGGALFVTFGDRGNAFEEAQSPFNAIGAVIRIQPDGSIPQDNPFADGKQGAPEVWSWGHRNIQSATLGTDGELWTVEHGPRGGDELNQPEPGVNHGWPIITYGINYNGNPIGQGITEQEGMAQPVYYWDPVIAPSGMATYTGELFEDWEGNLLVGGLQAQAVVRLSIKEGRVHTEEWIPMGTRVRSLAIANDGAVLVGTDDGEIVALRPE